MLGEADVVVDFTVPDTALGNVRACLEAGVHAVVGTTGFDLDAARAAAEASSANCFVAPNFAIGAVLLMEVAQTIAPHMPECEIVELHHDRKLDAPSGTAKRTEELIDARRRQRPPADPLGPPARPGRPPGSDLRRRGPDARAAPRLDRPPLVHARRAARRAQGRRAARPLHGRAREAAVRCRDRLTGYAGSDEGDSRHPHRDGDPVRRARAQSTRTPRGVSPPTCSSTARTASSSPAPAASARP